jgi:hypothetical protein
MLGAHLQSASCMSPCNVKASWPGTEWHRFFHSCPKFRSNSWAALVIWSGNSSSICRDVWWENVLTDSWNLSGVQCNAVTSAICFWTYCYEEIECFIRKIFLDLASLLSYLGAPGFGIHDIKVKNIALLSKWLFKLLTQDGVWQTLLKRKYVGSIAMSHV